MLNENVVSLDIIIMDDFSETPNIQEFLNFNYEVVVVVNFYVCVEMSFMKENGLRKIYLFGLVARVSCKDPRLWPNGIYGPLQS